MQASQRFIGVTAALFLGSAALTIAWCHSMSALHGVPMCSTRAAPMMHDAAVFLVMWLTMMVAMMLPSLMPMLLRYRRAVGVTARLDVLTAIVGLGYFFVWALFGIAAFLFDSILTDTPVPATATGAVVLIAGALQFSRWKTHHLACCRGETGCCEPVPAEVSAAWRHGVRLGVHCVHCCFGLTVTLLAIGMMDLRAMSLVTALVSLERLAPGGLRAARFVGGVLMAMGTFLIANAMS
jgi:predicted metal-binding membrane protein